MEQISSLGYPRIIGIDERNGVRLVEFYYCMDICPQHAGILLKYDSITSEPECDAIRGETVFYGIPSPPGTFFYCKPIID